MTRKPPRRLLVLIPVVIIVIALLVRWRSLDSGAPGNVITASGTVEATEAQLGFQLTGRIAAIAAHEGDRIGAAAELARLDPDEMVARRDQSRAQVAAARALLTEMEAGSRSEEVAQARAAHDGARERLADARRDLTRAQELFAGGAVSREVLDKAAVAAEVAASQEAAAAEQLELVRSGPRVERIAAQRAVFEQAEAALRAVEATLDNMVIRAPFAGIVTVRHREPGEVIAPGSPVLSLLNQDDRWVRIYIPETRIGAVQHGQPAKITADTYPDKIYGGQVVFIASEAEFTPKNVQTSEERVKLVYAVKVQITDDPTYDLKPGMPADVRIDLAP